MADIAVHPRTYAEASARASNTIACVGLLLGLAAAAAGVAPIGSIRPYQILLIAGIGLALLSVGVVKALAYRPGVVDLAALIYIAASSLSELVNAADLQYQSDLSPVVATVLIYLVYVAVRMLCVSPTEVVVLLRAFIVPAVLESMVALLQGLKVQAVINWSLAIAPSASVDGRFERGSFLRAWGLMGHWTSLGSYFAGITVCCMLVVLLGKYYSIRTGALPWVAAVAAVLGALVTLTISAVVISIAVILVAAASLGLRLGHYVGLIVAGVSGAIVFSASISTRLDQQFNSSAMYVDVPGWVPSTLAYRAFIWTSQTLPVIGQRPWTGWGDGVYGSVDPSRVLPTQLRWPSAESQWFAEAVSGGWLTTASLALVYLAFIATARRVENAAIRRTIGVFLLVVFIASLTAPVITDRGLPLVLWPLVAVASVLSTNGKLHEKTIH